MCRDNCSAIGEWLPTHVKAFVWHVQINYLPKLSWAPCLILASAGRYVIFRPRVATSLITSVWNYIQDRADTRQRHLWAGCSGLLTDVKLSNWNLLYHSREEQKSFGDWMLHAAALRRVIRLRDGYLISWQWGYELKMIGAGSSNSSIKCNGDSVSWAGEQHKTCHVMDVMCRSLRKPSAAAASSRKHST